DFADTVERHAALRFMPVKGIKRRGCNHPAKVEKYGIIFHVFKYSSLRPGRFQGVLTSPPWPDRHRQASIMSSPASQTLVVKISSVWTNSTSAPAGEITLIPHSPMVATQILPLSSTARLSKNL